MNDPLSLLTFDWFITRAIIGVSVGYFLRVLEHILWARKAPPDQNPSGSLGFSLMILPQCFLTGLTFGYLLLAVAAIYFKNPVVVEVCAYFLPALVSFLAIDFRDLLRRISRM